MKIKLLLISMFTIAFINQNFSQQLAKNQVVTGGSGSDQLRKLCAAKDGGILLAGQSNSNASNFKNQDSRGNYDYWVVKSVRNEKTGNIKIQWEKTIGGDDIDNLVTAKPTKDGGFILGGYSISGKSGEKTQNRIGGYDYWIVKLDSAGNIQWDKTIGDSDDNTLLDLDTTTDGGYILAGNLGLTKINNSGDVVWQQPGFYYTAHQLINGGFIATNVDDRNTLYLTSTDNNGNIKWTKDMGWSAHIPSFGAIQSNDGNLVFYHRGALSYSESDNYYFDFFIDILKLDTLGNQIWSSDLYTPDLAEEFYFNSSSLSQTKDGGYIFSTTSQYHYADYYVLKINNNGQSEWNKNIAASNLNYCEDVLEVGNGKYLVGGFSNSPISYDKTKASLGDYDFWVVGLFDTTSNNIPSGSIASISTKPPTQFLCYPNPVKDILHIQNSGKATFVLTNQSGKIALTKTINDNDEISVAHLPAGVYYLKNNQTGVSQKIIIVK